MVSENVVYYGVDDPLPEQTQFRAGPLTLLYEAGQIRHIKLGDVPVLHQVYAAVRDHNWDTIPGTISDLQINSEADRVAISFHMAHRQADIDFTWQGTISGDANGTLTFEMDGTANSTFKRNRIGFCVLHPTLVAGKPCTVEHTDGQREASEFPQQIAPHQPFFDIRAITHPVVERVEARVLMEGDTFEMEDQRNWTDASFKTYCTPLGLPFPVEVEAGTRIWQRITLTLHGSVPDVTIEDTGEINFEAGTESTPLPKIGLGMADEALTDEQIGRLKALQIDHLRVDLPLYEPDFAERLKQTAQLAGELGTQLELALFISDAAAQELGNLRGMLDALEPAVARLMIFHKDEKSTTRQWVEAARKVFTGVPLGTGTNHFFTELNRERPPADALDFVTYSINPQVHAFDNMSLVETLPVQATTVESAAAFSAGRDVVVSPVTLKMRFNPNATGPQPETPPGQLPPEVDVRQMSLFGAGWTLGSIKYLAGASSVTYYETVGMRGIMAGSSQAEQFYAPPTSVYPIYHVFAGAAGYSNMLASKSSDPLKVDGLVLHDEGKTRVLLANYTNQRQQVRLMSLAGEAAVYQMDGENVAEAMHNPEAFRTRAPDSSLQAGESLTMPPFSVFRIDSQGC